MALLKEVVRTRSYFLEKGAVVCGCLVLRVTIIREETGSDEEAQGSPEGDGEVGVVFRLLEEARFSVVFRFLEETASEIGAKLVSIWDIFLSGDDFVANSESFLKVR